MVLHLANDRVSPSEVFEEDFVGASASLDTPEDVESFTLPTLIIRRNISETVDDFLLF